MLLFLQLGHSELVQTSEELHEGDTVYHVANPDVAGKVVGQNGGVEVVFERPVSFSGNIDRGFEKYWICSRHLLHPTSAEAWRHRRF